MYYTLMDKLRNQFCFVLFCFSKKLRRLWVQRQCIFYFFYLLNILEMHPHGWRSCFVLKRRRRSAGSDLTSADADTGIEWRVDGWEATSQTRLWPSCWPRGWNSRRARSQKAGRFTLRPNKFKVGIVNHGTIQIISTFSSFPARLNSHSPPPPPSPHFLHRRRWRHPKSLRLIINVGVLLTCLCDWLFDPAHRII